MKKFLARAAGIGLLAGLGILSFGANPASASDGPIAGPQVAQSSANGDGVLAGNSAAGAVAVPIRICGNAVGVGVLGGGLAGAICELNVFSYGDNDFGPVAGPQVVQSTAEGDGVGTGNSIALPVEVPIDICGNAVGVGVGGLGLAGAACDVDLFSS